MEIQILQAKYDDATDAIAIGDLMYTYSVDPMGGAEALGDEIKDILAQELGKVPNAFTVLCRVDGKPAGLINCLQGFSTFKCKPLINIHDVIVAKEYRGLGLSQKMLEHVEQIARDRGCCKLTLEVLEGNVVARKAYQRFGFAGYELDPKHGKAMFWQKNL
ncbi:MAG: GNAT family N-acetyltransferase [Pseudomonadales bacterium]|nr:GNAT family N-acetyltransferase [Pseudomonadales bacterium]